MTVEGALAEQGRAAARIREAEPDDAEECGRVIYEAFAAIARQRGFEPDFESPEFAAQIAAALISHPGIYAVVTEREGRIVGCNFLDERDPIRGVGPTAVASGEQGASIGRRLTQAVIERGRESVGIRLCQDAHNPVSMSLYASLGFEAKEPLVVIGGTPSASPAPGLEVRALTEDDLPECERLYRAVHGVSRTNELADALRHPMLEPLAAVSDGRLVAYATSLAYWPLAHGVAESEEALRGLLLGAYAATGKPLSFLLPIRQASLLRWCLAEGLRVVKPVNLMVLGEYNEPRGAWFPSVQY